MLRLITHSGRFHADDAFAYATLRLALGGGDPGWHHLLVRTRDPAEISRGDIVWDVGGEFDAARRRFDHHQRGAPVREDGTPLSSAGLVWREYGRDAVRALVGESAPGDLVADAAAEVETDVVRRIDVIDNGVAGPEDSLGISDMVDDHNLSWDDPLNGVGEAEDAAFARAASDVEGFLRRRVEKIRARLRARLEVLAAHAASDDPRVLEMPTGMPWKGPVFSAGLPVLFAVFPRADGSWVVDAMPPEPGSFAQRLPLPTAWGGLAAPELAAASGVPDAAFVHPRLFLAVAGSRGGALSMAARAIELGGGSRADADPLTAGGR